MIFIIDDDPIMAGCVARATRTETKIFSNAIEAMNAMGEVVPDLIFLDVLLDGPDGFTLLHELASYDDTARIPVVIISSLDLNGVDLSEYGVRGILQKESMQPNEVYEYVAQYVK